MYLPDRPLLRQEIIMAGQVSAVPGHLGADQPCRLKPPQSTLHGAAVNANIIGNALHAWPALELSGV
jgi:hypothetical protein